MACTHTFCRPAPTRRTASRSTTPRLDGMGCRSESSGGVWDCCSRSGTSRICTEPSVAKSQAACSAMWDMKVTEEESMRDGTVQTEIAPTETVVAVKRDRLRSLIWPREHGAWGILLVPLVTGAAAALLQARSVLPIAFFLLASLALFCLRTPVEALLGTSVQRVQNAAERQAAVLAASFFCVVAAISLAALFWGGHNQALFLLGAASAVSFGAQALLRKVGRSTRLLSQIVGSIGLTSTSAGAYYVATGRLDATAYMIWAANWLFAANQIHMVQLRIRAAKVAGLY